MSTGIRSPRRFNLLNAGWIALGAAIALSVIGVEAIALTSDADIVNRQVVFLVISIAAALVCAAVPPRAWAALAWPLAIVTVLMLLVLLVPGIPDEIVRPRKGSRRWINFVVTEFQPSELAKLAFVLLLAWHLRLTKVHRKFGGLIVAGVYAAIPMGLIMVQPDLGTSMLFLPGLVVMLVVAGAKLTHLAMSAGLGVAAAGAIVVASVWFAQGGSYPLLRQYQVNRVLAVFDLHRGDGKFGDERAYQGTKAVLIAGSGGVTGNDEERAKTLIEFNHLPERHNDMIFPVIVHRWGFIGGLAVIGLYMMFMLSSLAVAAMTKDPFGRIAATGIGAMVAAQAGVNIGMTIGLFPITGLTLPFVSYGGSSLLVTFASVGLLCSIALRRPDRFWRESFDFRGDRRG